jgi:HD-like signal output (HDOD) protein
VLQLASSAFLGRVVPPRTVRDAVVFVGVTLMKAFVLTHRIVEMYQPKVQGFSVDAVQRAALMTGALASGMFATRARSEPAFVAGMMHNLGTLVLATRFPRRYAAVLRAQAGERRSLAHIEFDMLGATHAEVGAYLLGLWGIAPEVVEAVALAQSPSKIVDRTLGLSAAVYIASRLVHDPDTAVTPCEDRDGDIDAGLVNRLGLASELEGWRQAARHVVGEGSQ